MQKSITKFLILTIILTAALSVNYLFAAWTGPTQAPPEGNTSTPIHVGSTDQVKDGGLSLEGLSVFGGGYFQGNVGIGGIEMLTPTEALEVEGNVRATSFLYSSDRRLKKNIKPISGLENILKLQGVSFNWKKDEASDIGLIAQDVEKVLPELVSTNPITDLKSIKYGNLTAVLVEAVKEQQRQIDNQNIEIQILKSELELLKNSQR